MLLGHWFLALRKGAGLTQAEFAGRLKMSRTHLSSVENGESLAGDDLVDRAAREFGGPVPQLLVGQVPAEPGDADYFTVVGERCFRAANALRALTEPSRSDDLDGGGQAPALSRSTPKPSKPGAERRGGT